MVTRRVRVSFLSFCMRALPLHEARVIDTISYAKAAKFPRGHGYAVRDNTPTSIVLHSTNNKRPTTFASECDFLFRSPDVSAHFLVSKVGTIVQFLDPARFVAWHAGTAKAPWLNAVSIGIELHISVGERPTTAQLDAAGVLCSDLMARFRVSLAMLETHRAIALPPGRKSDPEGFDDAAFAVWRAGLGTHSYRVRVACAALSSNDLAVAALAPTAANPTLYTPGDLFIADDVTHGMAHDARGTGFVPVAYLERI